MDHVARARPQMHAFRFEITGHSGRGCANDPVTVCVMPFEATTRIGASFEAISQSKGATLQADKKKGLDCSKPLIQNNNLVALHGFEPRTCGL